MPKIQGKANEVSTEAGGIDGEAILGCYNGNEVVKHQGQEDCKQQHKLGIDERPNSLIRCDKRERLRMRAEQGRVR